MGFLRERFISVGPKMLSSGMLIDVWHAYIMNSTHQAKSTEYVENQTNNSDNIDRSLEWWRHWNVRGYCPNDKAEQSDCDN